KAVKVGKTISKRRWYSRKSAASLDGVFTEAEKKSLVLKLRRLGKQLPEKRATLTVLPLKALPQALASIPPGTIANLVHTDKRYRDTVVTHQILLIKKSDGWYVRHAASDKAVEDDPIAILAKNNDASWPLVGLNLVVLQDPTAAKTR